MRFRELILGAQEQSCQLGPFIMGPISGGGSRRGDESLSPCVSPPQIYPCSAVAAATLPLANPAPALGTDR